MQEYIINGLLVVVALLAAVLQAVGARPAAGMTKKQKIMLWRILSATVLLLLLQILGTAIFDRMGSAGRWVRLACYLVDYAIIGYDILQKALKGIRNGQVFDEHFLMAVATLGALALAVYENGDYLPSSLSKVTEDGYTLTGWYDKNESAGGRIRVIVAR